MTSALETLEGGDAPPPSPLGARTSCGTAEDTLRRTPAQRAVHRIAMEPLVAQTTDDHEDGQCRPEGQRDREHDESNAENEAVHLSVVVVGDPPALPRSRDPQPYGH